MPVPSRKKRDMKTADPLPEPLDDSFSSELLEIVEMSWTHCVTPEKYESTLASKDTANCDLSEIIEDNVTNPIVSPTKREMADKEDPYLYQSDTFEGEDSIVSPMKAEMADDCDEDAFRYHFSVCDDFDLFDRELLRAFGDDEVLSKAANLYTNTMAPQPDFTTSM